jgi:hypothetical protein
VVSVPVLAVSAFAWYQGYKSLWVVSLAVSRDSSLNSQLRRCLCASTQCLLPTYQHLTKPPSMLSTDWGGGAVVLHPGASGEGLGTKGPDQACRLKPSCVHISPELA